MNDFYTEQLIKKEQSAKDKAIKAVLLFLAAASVCLVLIIPIAVLAAAVFILGVIIAFKNLDIEYEYLYVNGDLDIDKILHKSRRKRVFSVNINDVEILAPEKAAEAARYQKAQMYDFSSGNTSAKKYVLVTKEKGTFVRILFEPNASIVEGMFLLAPRKVIRK